jgi:hypothetical protein
MRVIIMQYTDVTYTRPSDRSRDEWRPYMRHHVDDGLDAILLQALEEASLQDGDAPGLRQRPQAGAKRIDGKHRGSQPLEGGKRLILTRYRDARSDCRRTQSRTA